MKTYMFKKFVLSSFLNCVDFIFDKKNLEFVLFRRCFLYEIISKDLILGIFGFYLEFF